MAKLKRFHFEGHCYHVVTTTRNRAAIFRSPPNARVLEQALQFVRRERAYLLAYAIMPDHLHAVLVPNNTYNLSQVMQTVKGYASRMINSREGKRGPLWQRSFYDHAIRNEKELFDTIRYVHENPVVAGLIERPEQFPFSSGGYAASTDLERFYAD